MDSGRAAESVPLEVNTLGNEKGLVGSAVTKNDHGGDRPKTLAATRRKQNSCRHDWRRGKTRHGAQDSYRLER